MSIRTNPFEELESLIERMSRQFDDAAHAWETDSPLSRLGAGPASMAVDLVDHDDEFVATVDLPGFEREQVDVEVTDHTLRIAAESDESHEEHTEQYLRQERQRESVQRSLRLPAEVDTTSVTARMRNGVVTITLPKLETEPARHIDIEDA